MLDFSISSQKTNKIPNLLYYKLARQKSTNKLVVTLSILVVVNSSEVRCISAIYIKYFQEAASKKGILSPTSIKMPISPKILFLYNHNQDFIKTIKKYRVFLITL